MRFHALMTASAVSALAVSLAGDAFAQTMQLPGITVEGQKARPRRQQAAEPVAEPQAVETAPTPEQLAAEKAAAQRDMPYQVPAGISVVGRSEIQTFGSTNLDDVLRTIPGVSTRESTNAGVAVNIRGFEGSGRVNMMIDGVRQNFRFTTHEASGFTYVDPNLLAGVDIARGAVATAGGAGALAGTANFRTLDVDDIIKPGQNTGVLTTATWGSNNIGWSEMAAAGVRSGSVGFAGAISRHDQGNFENGDGKPVPFTEETLTSGLFKLEFRPSSEHFLKFGGVLYHNDFPANGYNMHVQSNTFTMNYAYRPVGNPLVDFRFNVYKNDVTNIWRRDQFSSADGRNIDVEGMGFDVANTSRFNVGAIKVKTEYGYEYFGTEFDVINSTANPNQGVNPSGDSSISALFSQTTFTYGLADLIVGGRYDMFTLKGSGAVSTTDPNPVNLPPGPYHVDRDDARFNPKVTLALNPWNWLQPYATYSEAMRMPTVNETFAGGQHPGGGAQGFAPNPFLEPEISKGWEFGFNVKRDGLWVPQDLFRFKAAYYVMDVENYITACFGAGGATFFCNNPGISKVQGVELQGMYDARYVFAGLSYTYTHSNLPEQINGFGATSYLPDHQFALTAGMRFLQQRLTAGARVTYASDAKIGATNVANGYIPTDAYTLLDLFSSYKFDNGIELGATVTNVFDLAYTPALMTGPTCSFSNPTPCDVELGRGRTFLLTAKAQF